MEAVVLCRADDAGEGGCLRPVLDVHGVPGCCRRLLRVVHNGDQVGLVVSWGALLCPLALRPGQEFWCLSYFHTVTLPLVFVRFL